MSIRRKTKAPKAPPQDLELLRNVCGVLQERDLERVLQLAMDSIVALSGAERAMLVRRDPDGATRIGLSRGRPDVELSTSVIDRALETKAPVVIPNALEDPDFSDRRSVQTLKLLSALAVPLLAKGRAIACVYADSTRATGIFPPALADRLAQFADRIAPAVEAALAEAELGKARTLLRKDLDAGGGFEELLGESPRFLRVLEDTTRVAPTAVTVLIRGESGTGKELLARALHARSRRAGGPFIPVNCAALPDQLLESELFGHVRGAFTGAVKDRKGKLQAAAGGTLFLDEVGEIPLIVQAKLLRAVERCEIQPVGADHVEQVDVRFLAATHRDLEEAVRAGAFREDLLFRLRVVELTVPPLRERPEDVRLLADAFLTQAAARNGLSEKPLDSAATEALLRYPFPGNVRELAHALEQALIFSRGPRITLEDLPDTVTRGSGSGGLGARPRTKSELDLAKERAGLALERAFLEDALARAKGKVAQAARLTGMNRSVLHTLMKKHGLKAKSFA